MSHCREQNVPSRHIIPPLPSLSFPGLLLKQPTPAPWPALCGWPRGAKTEFDPRHPQGKTWPSSGCPRAFLCTSGGIPPPPPAQPARLLFPASSLQAKAQVGRNQEVAIVWGFIGTEGKVCCALPPYLAKTRQRLASTCNNRSRRRELWGRQR